MSERIREKLKILADAAKYDVSCSSSGSFRKNKNYGLGNATGMGICHSYTEDGRCVSLLKILLTNYCIYDCAYCVTRISNEIKRAAFTVQEVVDLTLNFYRRNYIEGLFLSSGIFKNPDYTMERLVRVARRLREEHNFNGYIHLKSIPGANDELMHEAGLYADRLSVNIELPTEASLKKLAPEKNFQDIEKPMGYLAQAISGYKNESLSIKNAPLFAPAGQSSQMIIGASNETDQQIMVAADKLYKNYRLKRVYYSGYIPVADDNRLPALGSAPPLLRENRLYQSDWLIRFYGFSVQELFDAKNPNLDPDFNPKLSWALRNRHLFPIDINIADYEQILRIPGIGVKSAKKIVAARKFALLNWDQLVKIGISMNISKYFLVCKRKPNFKADLSDDILKNRLLASATSKYHSHSKDQLSLF